MPIQKLGQAWPITAMDITAWSDFEPLFTAANMPAGMERTMVMMKEDTASSSVAGSRAVTSESAD